MTKDRQYYSVRKGLDPRLTQLDLSLLRELFLPIYQEFDRQGYFQEAFGYDCVDAGYVPGCVGYDVKAYFFRKLRKPNLWPIETNLAEYTDDDLFDVIELLHDQVSKPLTGCHHTYSDCGWHYDTFDKAAGQGEFRAEMNEILRDYPPGYELSPEGEILEIGDVGMQTLFEAELPELDPENVKDRVEAAIRKFRRRGSSLDDRRDAVKSLADVLEFLRPRLQEVITKKDDGALFQIANQFGIRHHNVKQKTDYDQAVWLSWMFYFYLATIHAVTRLIKKAKEEDTI